MESINVCVQILRSCIVYTWMNALQGSIVPTDWISQKMGEIGLTEPILNRHCRSSDFPKSVFMLLY